MVELQYYDETADNPPWIKSLAEVRRHAALQGWCYQHVQAIIVAIDQYAEAALGNRNYFLNRPHNIGGEKTTLRKSDVQSLFDHDQPSRHPQLVSGNQSLRR
jgi:hypothetical protein